MFLRKQNLAHDVNVNFEISAIVDWLHYTTEERITNGGSLK